MPERRKQVDHKDAVLLLLKQASLGARAAPIWTLPINQVFFLENSAQVLQSYIRFLYGRDCVRTMMKSAKRVPVILTGQMPRRLTESLTCGLTCFAISIITLAIT
ncbi:hypothetical protein YEP4_05961 [Yersinia enterocolitica subsp. palearctica YE-P4]|nr:hypothetical protein YE149_05996 [Yersinia enterocolitica subsp. palearctica YE-149]EOR78676.1 hypothetical protein YEP1_05991 [Yersinia enterocolitica subsp. palearctica YE-P1]EOR78752.1 hypothetical protein YE150_05966 [Yersinia enterocolitica subsp. palearctica YE-150]EOR82706.1 hypothetical protein YEP4_05961 [Yersinia enterocolitica subsp. palearctica YE-P4]QBP99006.1 hypothetical protein YEY1_09560 [Yersinia enterocolitica subsp. palearctica]